MNEPIDQHTNPKMSLKRFAEKGWLSKIENSSCSRIATKTASVIPNFYTAEFLSPDDKYKYENDFSRVEDRAAKIFDKLQKDGRYSPTKAELETISEFVSWQFLRTQASRSEMNNALDAMQFPQDFKEFIITESDFFINCMDQNFNRVFDILSQRVIGVTSFVSDSHFLVTSDNPVLVISKEGKVSSSAGIGDAQIVAYPLSRDKLLTFTPLDDANPTFDWISIRGLSSTQSFNLLLYFTSNFRIYCHPSDSERFKDLLKANYLP